MSPAAAALMRRNLLLCAQQMDDLADKAKSTVDAAAFVRGAAIYPRLAAGLQREGGASVDPPPQPERLT